MLFPGSRQLRLAGILATFALAGCGSGHSGGAGGTGYATFAWYLFDIEDSSYTTALTCAEVGATSVVVTLTNQATGTVYTQTAANCADGAMSTTYVPAGSYTAGFDLYGNPAIYGNSTTLLDSFDATGLFPIHAGANDFRSEYAPFIVQSFTVAWSVYYQSALTTCAAVGATYVDLDFAVAGSSSWVTSPFNCATGSGVSYAIPYFTTPTTAQWKLYLVDATGTVDLQVIDGGTVTLPTTTNVNLPTQYFTY
jgi:hypothetical protein